MLGKLPVGVLHWPRFNQYFIEEAATPSFPMSFSSTSKRRLLDNTLRWYRISYRVNQLESPGAEPSPFLPLPHRAASMSLYKTQNALADA